ncbi:MAG TPA: hypothetical protein VL974_13225 [Magnetospirillum sp.]|jgi:hypothetical protein|nr:hypothetical protein [Magnetospirillum sp.]
MMNNVVYVRPQLEGTSRVSDARVSANLVKSAITRLLAFARGEGMDNTAMTLELALTAVDVDYEERQR